MASFPSFPETIQSALNQWAHQLEPASLQQIATYLAGVAHAKKALGNGASQVLTPEQLAAAATAQGLPAAQIVPTEQGGVVGQGGPTAQVAPSAAGQSMPPVTIIFGSQTGNAERVAEALHAECLQLGLDNAELVRADRYNTRNLKKEHYVFIVMSTHGDGDPPDDSIGFVEFLLGARAPKLPDLKFGILGLGDSSYPLFCSIATDIEERLLALGATPFVETGLADVDIDTVAKPWLEKTINGLSLEKEQFGQAVSNGQNGQAITAAQMQVAAQAVVAAQAGTVEQTLVSQQQEAVVFNREQPFSAMVLDNQRITGRGSTRDVFHLELCLEDSGLTYAPGDSLGVWPTQDERLVEAVLAQVGCTGDEAVAVNGVEKPLHQWLRHERELTLVTRPFLQKLAERADADELKSLLQPEARADLSQLLNTHQLLDVLQRFATDWSATDLVQALRPLAPRMYSIASSQLVVGPEVHLTVANINYEFKGQERWGVATNYLAQQGPEDHIPVFVDANPRFALPAEGDTDLIMIGPGTGVAPFRAFIQERQELGHSGRHWLFFGNPHFRTDFLYHTEWLRAREEGLLTRMDVAFSRDQKDKVYVQHRLLEQARELYEWLDQGAYLYVCGDAHAMAKDVHAALAQVGVQGGGLDEEQATAWLQSLSDEGRYLRDVY